VKDANRHLAYGPLRRGASRVALLLALLSAAACKSIIGLEDHVFVDGDAGASQADLKSTCGQYCTDAVKNCTADGSQAYAKNSIENCLAICEHLPAGAKGAMDGNSASCRAFYAKDAAGGENEQLSCSAAAPGGGSPPPPPKSGEPEPEPLPACGTNCDAYCSVYKQVCPEAAFVDPDCQKHCPGIFDRGTFSASSDFDGADDTIQCRLAHLTAAAFYKKQDNDPERKNHCGHSKLEPSRANDGLPCDLQPDKAPSCENYCGLIMTACEEAPQYESSAQCLKFCQGALKADALPKGTIDSGKDTLNCRRWHSYAAMFEETSHCGHAGPTGDGHCAENVCSVYCGLLEKSCGTRFSKEFTGGAPTDQCRMQCEKLTGGSVANMGYSVNKSETRENTFFCRVRNLVKVFESRMSGTGMGMAACDKPGIFPADPCTPLP
jgi:hypothetical protein